MKKKHFCHTIISPLDSLLHNTFLKNIKLIKYGRRGISYISYNLLYNIIYYIVRSCLFDHSRWFDICTTYVDLLLIS